MKDVVAPPPLDPGVYIYGQIAVAPNQKEILFTAPAARTAIAEVVCHTDHCRHNADRGDLRLDARWQTGRAEESLLDRARCAVRKSPNRVSDSTDQSRPG